MTEIAINLPWWPPEPDEPIGTARAAELVAVLRQVAPPVVDHAEADLRSRLDPGAEIVRNGEPGRCIARFCFDDLR